MQGMELVNQATEEEVNEGMCRIEAAATLLEKTVAWLAARQASLAGEVQGIVATVEQNQDARIREKELEQKLAVAEEQIAALQAQATEKEEKPSSVRKTLPAATVHMLGKQGLDDLDHVDASSLDAALTGLSLEQRIAVKSQLLRSGSLSK
jgi:hypothetical protein